MSCGAGGGRYYKTYGRGAGVGRGRGIRVGLGVGVGVGVGVEVACTSYEPTSIRLPRTRSKPGPR
ncbi:MAG: hypothetical protein DME33_04170 [Verrucomicrobia bacterium]|nr:MAG: hypothetical protein DME33_04170 [Verrucomicrobiota bacterium]